MMASSMNRGKIMLFVNSDLHNETDLEKPQRVMMLSKNNIEFIHCTKETFLVKINDLNLAMSKDKLLLDALMVIFAVGRRTETETFGYKDVFEALNLNPGFTNILKIIIFTQFKCLDLQMTESHENANLTNFPSFELDEMVPSAKNFLVLRHSVQGEKSNSLLEMLCTEISSMRCDTKLCSVLTRMQMKINQESCKSNFIQIANLFSFPHSCVILRRLTNPISYDPIRSSYLQRGNGIILIIYDIEHADISKQLADVLKKSGFSPIAVKIECILRESIEDAPTVKRNNHMLVFVLAPIVRSTELIYGVKCLKTIISVNGVISKITLDSTKPKIFIFFDQRASRNQHSLIQQLAKSQYPKKEMKNTFVALGWGPGFKDSVMSILTSKVENVIEVLTKCVNKSGNGFCQSATNTPIALQSFKDVDIMPTLAQSTLPIERNIVTVEKIGNKIVRALKNSSGEFYVLTGPTGYGKSQILSELNKFLIYNQETHLVIYMDANDLENLPQNLEKSPIVFKFALHGILSKKINDKSTSCDLKLQDILEFKRMILLLDGFDELVCENVRRDAKGFAKGVFQLGYKVILAASESDLNGSFAEIEQLEKIEMYPVDDATQFDYLAKKLQGPENNVTGIQREVQNSRLSLENPMFLSMFADLCLENIIAKNIISLVESYIKVKVLKANSQLNEAEKDLMCQTETKYLESYATQIVCDNVFKTFATMKYTEVQIEIQDHVIPDITELRNGKLCFTHQTFRDYFVASYMTKEENCVFSLANALTLESLKGIRLFLDEFFNQEYCLHEKFRHILCRPDNLKLLSSKTTELMHNIIGEGLDNIFQFFMKSELKQILQIDSLLNPSSSLSQKWNKKYAHSPLYFSCKASEKISLLIMQSADIEMHQVQKDSVLHSCAKNGFIDMLKILLQKFPSLINEVDTEGLTPLHYAAFHSKIEAVRCLVLNSNINVNAASRTGTTALHLAAKNADMDILKCLLIRGTDLNQVDHKGLNALHYASKSDKSSTKIIEVVNIMTNFGGNLNCMTNDGESPLSFSLENSNLMLFRTLLSKGANPDVTNVKNWNLLHKLASSSVSEVQDVFEKLGNCPINGLTELGKTPLHIAAETGNTKMVQLLFEKEANFLQHDLEGLLPIHYAALGNHVQIIKQILDYGCDINIPITGNANTALHLAAKADYIEAVDILLEKGAAVNFLNSLGQSPLHLAVENNCIESARLLIGYGANPQIADTSNSTPVKIAEKNGLNKIKEIFELKSLVRDFFNEDSAAGPSASGSSENNEKKGEVMDVELAFDEIEVDWENKKRNNRKRCLAPGHLNDKLHLELALHRYFTFPADYDVRAKIKRFDLAQSGFFFVYNFMSLQCYHCTYEIKSLTGWQDLNLEQINDKHYSASREEFGRACPFLRGDGDINDIPIFNPINYVFEAHRLYSLLEHQWGNPNVTVYELARNGFYYTGQDDNCRCNFCKLEVRGWEPGDTAEGEHRRWNPRCAFHQQSTDNIEIGQEVNPDVGDLQANPFVKTPISQYGPHVHYCKYVKNWIPVETLGVTLVGDMKYRQYSTIQSRQSSFKDWPKQLKQTPDILSKAGFFYTGSGDRVLCFQCGGGLKDWDPKDSPWIEHAKWFERCPYLNIKKGRDYISHVVHNNTEPGASNIVLDNTSFQGDQGSMFCRYCKSKNINCVSLPCGHMTACIECVEKETKCLECKSYRSAFVEVFLS